MGNHMPGNVSRGFLLLLGIVAIFLKNAELASIFMTGSVVCEVVRSCAHAVIKEIRRG